MKGTSCSTVPLNTIKDVMVALHRSHVDHTLLWNDTAPLQGNAEAVAACNTSHKPVAKPTAEVKLSCQTGSQARSVHSWEPHTELSQHRMQDKTLASNTAQ